MLMPRSSAAGLFILEQDRGSGKLYARSLMNESELGGVVKKIKNEGALMKEAIRVGTIYLEKRGVHNFAPTDDINFKAKAIYTLLVMDNVVQPLPKDQESNENIKHKLAIWISKRLPANHELLS